MVETSFAELEAEQEGNEGGEKKPPKGGQSQATGLYESVHTWMFISYVHKIQNITNSTKKAAVGRFFHGHPLLVHHMYPSVRFL